MSLKIIREGELKEVFDALEEAFNATGTDYYLIGAFARDIWYTKGNKNFRQTKDVDFAVLVGSASAYEAIKEYLKQHKNFQDTKGNSFVMFTSSGVQIDILPFGNIEIDDAVDIQGGGLTNIKVNGFMEVYQGGTTEIKTETGHNFKVATLPSIRELQIFHLTRRASHFYTELS
jgi:predicted nucleotidyltransferase